MNVRVSLSVAFSLAVLFSALPIWLPSADHAQTASAEESLAPRETVSETVVANLEQANLEQANLEQAEFKQAGVCSRCHVVSVLEWSLSGHVAAETSCQSCHGESRAHVANERNEIEPDRLPRGDAIAAALCATCHESGCPNTLEMQSCQDCHHVHALIHPSETAVEEDHHLQQLLDRWTEFQRRTARGEELVLEEQWQPARDEFRAATRLVPGNRRAQQRLKMCLRRIHPEMPGFTRFGAEVNQETGLPTKVRVDELEATMLLVPAGECDIGSEQLPDSRPIHTVRVGAFYLGRHEVTQSQWEAIMEANPSVHQGEGFSDADRRPVERVSWDDCQEFLRRLNVRVAGGGFRLPTELEWEYACRGGQTEAHVQFAGTSADASEGSPRWPAASRQSGDLVNHAWSRTNSLRSAEQADESQFLDINAYAPRPVGTLRPNEWGFQDMHGNVAEWCADRFRPYLSAFGDHHALEDGDGVLTGGTVMRVLRGGSYADAGVALDAAYRHATRPQRRLRWNGLRLARNVPVVDLDGPSDPVEDR